MTAAPAATTQLDLQAPSSWRQEDSLAGPGSPATVPDVPGPPPWAVTLPGLASLAAPQVRADALEVRLARGGEFSRVAVVLPGVRSMDILTFQEAVAEGYRAIFDQLAAIETKHPLRFWNFVPDIHADLGAGLDRYMAFNTGRFSAYAAWCGGRDAIGRAVATGSAVGVTGDRLEIHCLAGRLPGTPVENPRQTPAYRYSRHFGPLPPCFSRATALAERLPGGGRLLVGGTASIRGEDSLHAGNLVLQTQETLANLASLVRSACEPGSCDERSLPLAPWLSRFRELRVYLPQPEHGGRVLDMVSPHFTAVARIEVLQAALCRAELLVELEGVADIECPVPPECA
jgi:chorismate lyase / 3-hydroxybenzoate synthase